jgi:hypothetical protein
MDYGNLAQWVGAVATSSAVVVALFREAIIRRFRYPVITAQIEAKPPYCVKTTHSQTVPGSPPWKGWRYFLRLWIENKGNVRAENVEVFLSGAWVQRNGSYEPVPNFAPMNLRWSNTDYNKPVIYTDGISPDMARFCDFGAISDPACPTLKSLSGEKETDTRLSLRLESISAAAEWLLPGKYKFEVKLAASNCEPSTHHIELHLTGLWSDDPAQMLSHGIVLAIN